MIRYCCVNNFKYLYNVRIGLCFMWCVTYCSQHREMNESIFFQLENYPFHISSSILMISNAGNITFTNIKIEINYVRNFIRTRERTSNAFQTPMRESCRATTNMKNSISIMRFWLIRFYTRYVTYKNWFIQFLIRRCYIMGPEPECTQHWCDTVHSLLQVGLYPEPTHTRHP